MYDGLKIGLKLTNYSRIGVNLVPLFGDSVCYKEKKADFGEVGHMGVVLNKNIRACNPLPPSPTDRW